MNSPSTLGKAIALILSWLDEEEKAADSQLVEGQESAATNQTAKAAQRVNSTRARGNKQNGGDV